VNFEIKEQVLLVNDMELYIPNLYFIKEIGKGANAKVFLAYNNLLNRKEAVKIWVPKKGHVKVDKKRFFEEVKKNANVHFPHIATFYDANTQNGLYYARLEFIPGQTLKMLLREGQAFVNRYTILQSILETMKLVYDTGYYHGDLHTGNIIVNEYTPYIIDFGTSIFSGISASQERDCRKLVELCYEVLPELRRLNFIDNAKIIKQGSKIAAGFLMHCLLIIWNFETRKASRQDGYDYRNWRFCLDILVEEFQFVDIDLVNKFYEENFSKI
jgi:Serine/threonine protein kinase